MRPAIAIMFLLGLAACSDSANVETRKDNSTVPHTPPPPPPVGPPGDPMIDEAMRLRDAGARTDATGLEDINAGVEEAIKRRRLALVAPVKEADARDLAAQQGVERSDRGTPAQREAIVKHMKDAWSGGHSPQANAYFDGQAKAEEALRTKVARALTLPKAEIAPAVDKAVKDFPDDADEAVEDARQEATDDQVLGLIKAAAPLAAFAGCLALGGGAICAAVATFIGQVLGGDPSTDLSTQLGAMLTDVAAIAAGTCDENCFLGLFGGSTKVPNDAVRRQLFKGLADAGRDYQEFEEPLKKALAELPHFVNCAKDIGDPARELASSNACKQAFKRVGLREPKDYIDKLATCVDIDDQKQALCLRIHVKL